LRNIFPDEEQGIKQSHDALRHLVNQAVVDPQGRDVGRVRNIVVGESGGINYLIIASGDRLVPIPWNIANPTLQGDRVRISVNRQTIEDAPGFDSDEWPNFASRSIEDRVHGYYGEQRGASQRDLGRRTEDRRDLNR
jgi:sporulation protein YlmC with PRC-barrel domain